MSGIATGKHRLTKWPIQTMARMPLTDKPLLGFRHGYLYEPHPVVENGNHEAKRCWSVFNLEYVRLNRWNSNALAYFRHFFMSTGLIGLYP